MSNIFSENIRKFRLQKKLTQEQVADSLGVTVQTVSRWECGNALPDILRLPDLAKLYCVTIDDFYKTNSVAYRNYAERLVTVYEKTDLPEDFLAAEFEFRKMITAGNMTMKDMYNYALLNDLMYINARRKAREWYNKIINMDYREDPDSYYTALDFITRINVESGDGYDDIIPYHKERVEKDKTNPHEWCSLCEGLYYCKRFDELESTVKEAFELFPDHSTLYVYLGTVHEHYGRYDEALFCFDKFETLSPKNHIGLRLKAWLYEAYICDYEKAYNIWLDIAQLYKDEGFDLEAEVTRENADRVKAKML